MDGDQCQCCHKYYRGVRGMSLHLRKNRACDRYYASIDTAAHTSTAQDDISVNARGDAVNSTRPQQSAIYSQGSAVARLPSMNSVHTNDDGGCWWDDDESAIPKKSLRSDRRPVIRRSNRRRSTNTKQLEIVGKTMHDEQSGAESDSVASVTKPSNVSTIPAASKSVPVDVHVPVGAVPVGAAECDMSMPDVSVLQLHQQLTALQSDEFGLDRYSIEDRMQLELLHILKSHRLPLNTFAPTLAFAIKLNALGVSLEHAPKTRKTIIAKLFKHFNMEAMAPRQKACMLPMGNKAVNVVFFNARAVFASLLSCPFLNQDHKYMFRDATDIFLPPCETNEVSDINTGSIYRATYAKLVKDPGTDVLLPVIMGLDKTHIDASSRLQMEPLTMSHGLLKHEFRSQPSAMRILGYINLSPVHYRASSLPMTGKTRMSVAAAKLNDYHAQIEFILRESGYLQLQDQGFNWNLHFRGREYPVTFRTYVPFIVGDTEGHDRLCGHYTARFDTIQQLCRICKCPTELSHYSKGKFRKRYPKEMQALLAANDDAGHRAFSQSFLYRNGFDGVRFGYRPSAKPDRGIFGATPGEILHLVLLGWFKYCMEAFVTQMGGPKSTYAALFDSLCAEIGERLQRQSDREVPRTNFPKGFSTVANLKGHEIVGCLVVMLFAIQTSRFKEIFAAPRFRKPKQLGDSQHVADWILLLECLLQWHQWLKEPSMTKRVVQRSQKPLRWLMRHFQKVAPREIGMEYNLIKFHLVLHLAEDILDHGVPQNVNSAFTESAHIPLAKHTARNTQKRRSSFTYQAAKRYVENLALELAFYETGHQPLLRPANASAAVTERASGLFVVTALNHGAGDGCQLRYQWHNTTRQHEATAGLLSHSPLLTAFLVSSIFVHVPNGFELQCYTDFAKSLSGDGKPLQVFRTHPCYQQRPWYDCALISVRDEADVEKESYIDVPARLYAFVDLRNPETCAVLNDIRRRHHPYESPVVPDPIVPDFYFICETYKSAPAAVIDNDETSTTIIGMYHRIETANGDPLLELVSTKKIVEPLFGMRDIVPNPPAVTKPTKTRAKKQAPPCVPYYLFFVKPRHLWAQCWEDRILMRIEQADNASSAEEGDALQRS